MNLKPLKLLTSDYKNAAKTALAGALAMFLAEVIRLPQPYWSAISAVIVMQSAFDATRKLGMNQIIGTAIGAVVVLPFAEFMPGNLFGFGIAVIIAMLICSAFRLEDAKRLSASTVALIMLIHRQEAPWISGVERFLEVSFGIVVSLIVTRIIWPQSSQDIADAANKT